MAFFSSEDGSLVPLTQFPITVLDLCSLAARLVLNTDRCCLVIPDVAFRCHSLKGLCLFICFFGFFQLFDVLFFCFDFQIRIFYIQIVSLLFETIRNHAQSFFLCLVDLL